MSWEEKFQSWSQALSVSEKEKCENAERAVKRALNTDKTLAGLDVRVFAQGSYNARTNIKLESDVDICVCLQEPFFTLLPEGKRLEDYGLTTGSLSFSDYKGHVENALVNYFGKDNVKKGSKAFKVPENTYRIVADVVPTMAFRLYTGNGATNYIEPTGVKFISDKGEEIVNWPEQTYANGVSKNDQTDRRYKGIIRILKRLRNEMQDENIQEANDIASFLIESLVWNVTNEGFRHDKLSDAVKFVIAHCYHNTLSDEKCKEWSEVNELKYLFSTSQPWTRKKAHDFLSAAWDYIGFK